MVSGVTSSLFAALGNASATLLKAPPKAGAITGILILTVDPASITGTIPVIVLPLMLKLEMQVALPELTVHVGLPEIVKAALSTFSNSISIAVELVILLLISTIQLRASPVSTCVN